MFRIMGKGAAARAVKNRTGMRSRRLPSLVLSSGAQLKIHPHRYVFVTEADLRANLELLAMHKDAIILSLAVPPYTEIGLDALNASAEPVIEDVPEPVVEDAPEPVVEDAPEPVVEDVPEPVVEDVPEPVVEDVPEPVVEDVPEPVVEDAPKKRGRKPKKRD
jgi:outer membrane biosynthesis protein TonB